MGLAEVNAAAIMAIKEKNIPEIVIKSKILLIGSSRPYVLQWTEWSGQHDKQGDSLFFRNPCRQLWCQVDSPILFAGVFINVVQNLFFTHIISSHKSIKKHIKAPNLITEEEWE